MPLAIEELKPELAVLSGSDRAELARFLIESLDEEADPDAEAAWDSELHRRGTDIRRGAATSRPAAEVFEELHEKHA